MPFGLTNAPVVFQNLVNDILHDMLGRFVFVYLDDILIFSQNLKGHVQHVRLVLQRLLKNRLYVKAEKCKFHTFSVDFLSFIIECGHVRAHPSKVREVTDWPVLESRTHLQRFLLQIFIDHHQTHLHQTPIPEGPPKPRRLLLGLRHCSPPPQSSSTQTLASSSWLRWTPPPLEWGLCCLSVHQLHPCAFFSRRLSGREELRRRQSGAASSRPLPA